MIIIKRLIYLTSILLFFVSSQSVTSIPKVNSFGKGEELSYRIKFGVFTVAKATTRISKELVTINSTPCYKVEAFGETLSWVSIIKPVKDNFGTFLDTTHLSTQMAFRKLREGGTNLMR